MPSNKGQSVRVMCRVRPLISREKAENHSSDRLKIFPDDKTKVQVTAPADRGTKKYHFDEVFPPGTSQNHVYDSFASEAVQAAFEGYHGVLFVYGQTASGKTFTISNDDPDNLGMIQQSMFNVWKKIQEDSGNANYTCRLSYVEIYNEKVTDLLGDVKGSRAVKLVSAGRGEVIMYKEGTQDVVGVPVSGYDETMKYFRAGTKNKSMGATNQNEHSSRSHTVLTLDIEKSNTVTAAGSSANLTALKGRLVLCDLAGSERVSKTKAEGATLKEANNINLSLLVLGNVVKALTEKSAQFAPFRGSQLTRLLQYSLSGHGKTSIIVTVSSSDNETEETIGSINFGQRAIQIKQNAQKHEVRDYQALYLDLQRQLDQRVDDGIEDAVKEERRRCEEEMAAKDSQIELLTAENFQLKKDLAAGVKGGTASPPRHADPAAQELVRKSSTQEILAAASSHESSGFSRADEIAILDRVTMKLKETAGELQSVQVERHDLKSRLQASEKKLLALGVRYRDMVVTSMVQKKAWMNELNDAKGRLAAAQGMDFVPLSLESNRDQEEAEISSNGTGGRQGAVSPSSVALGEADERLEAELEKAYKAIARLREERTELFIYQKKAEDAIRYLHSKTQQRK